MSTTDQPDSQPTRKVSTATAAGALTTVAVFVADQFGLEVPAFVAGAVTTLLVFLAGYFVKERVPTNEGT
jgi:ABC-type enterobactin transport system permease subunit